MSVLEEALRGHRVVIDVPRGGVEDWVAIAEVLLQEGLGAWTLPPPLFFLFPEVLAIFGRRARVGASGVTDAAGVRSAVAAGAHFVLSPVHDASLADAAGSVPLVMGGLTPVEVAAAARAGADTVLVAPADAFGTAYARTLPPMFPDVALIACGRLERYQCQTWLEAGSRAVVVQDVVLRPEDGAGVNSPEEVSRRAAQFRALHDADATGGHRVGA